MSDWIHFEHIDQMLETVPADSIVSRSLVKDAQLNVILFGFAAGQELSEHTSSRSAILHFLQGKARLTLGQEVMPASAGTWVKMPPHLPHSILAETPVTMLLIMLAE